MKSCVPRMAKMKKKMMSTMETLAMAARLNTMLLKTILIPADRVSIRSGLMARRARRPWAAAALDRMACNTFRIFGSSSRMNC